MITLLLFFAGLALLIVGAEALVRGASRLAAAIGISPLVIGLTVVAFGTSAPELAVSIKAGLAGQASIAVGNVIGSNIFNVLMILGLSALVAPLVVSQQLVRFDVPLMIGVSVLMLVFALDGAFSRREGLILVAGLVLYIGFLLVQSRKERQAVKDEYVDAFAGHGRFARAWPVNVALVVVGLVLLVLGSGWLVDGAVNIAHYFGVSELVIGLTIVAAGTSLPELVTSLVASLRGQRDIAVGNVVGSNLFNIMGVLGIASTASPHGIPVSPAVIHFDIPVMIAVAFACLPIFFTGGRISRWEGGVLLGYYLLYTLYLILAANHFAALPKFNAAMLYFVIPLTLLTLILLALQEWRQRHKH